MKGKAAEADETWVLRDPEAASAPVVPRVSPGVDQAVIDETIDAAKTLPLDELSFTDRCRVVGVAPLDSGMCVETAACPNGAIVPIGGPARRTVPGGVGSGTSSYLGTALHIPGTRYSSRFFLAVGAVGTFVQQ